MTSSTVNGVCAQAVAGKPSIEAIKINPRMIKPGATWERSLESGIGR
ncbi:MAG: hypothetical protein WA899_16170 [Candidatus Sulfotelmatobacter sp.]